MTQTIRTEKLVSTLPGLLMLPVFLIAAAAFLRFGVAAFQGGTPIGGVLFFLGAFLTLGVMVWPYMVPYQITVANAAAPDVSLQFLFYGGVVVLPVIAVYTIGVYWVFRGKVHDGYEAQVRSD